MDFKIIRAISKRETIAVGNAIRELPRLRRIYGKGRWAETKGTCTRRAPGWGDPDRGVTLVMRRTALSSYEHKIKKYVD